MRNIKPLTTSEARMLLQFLGIKLNEQPKPIREAKGLIEAYKRRDVEIFNKAYDFVVDQKSPDGAVEKVVPINQARDLIAEEIKLLKDNALSVLEYTFKKDGTKLLEDIETSFMEAVERESKKFNTVKHFVHTGKSKKKEIKGIVCEEFETLLQLAKERINTLMVGPSGCGKTHVSFQIADAMDLPYASQSCSAGVSESVFTGKLLPLGTHGKFEYVESDFVRIYEGGGLFLFDEIDAADSNVMVFLNQALANESFHCAQRIGKTVVKKHKNFIAIGAANTFGTGADSLYTGRNSLDAATLDRFRLGTVVMEYSKQVEEAILDTTVLDFGRKIRQRITMHNLKKILSTRFMKDATTMKQNQKWTMEKIQDMYFADWSREEIAVIGGKLDFPKELTDEEKAAELKRCSEEAVKLSELLEEKEKFKENMKKGNENIIDVLKRNGKLWEKDMKRRIYFDAILGQEDARKIYYDLTLSKFVNWNLSTKEAKGLENKILAKCGLLAKVEVL